MNMSLTGIADDPAARALFEEISETFYKKTGVRLEPETPEQSVAAQLKLIDGLKPSDNGLFLEHTGGEYGL